MQLSNVLVSRVDRWISGLYGYILMSTIPFQMDRNGSDRCIPNSWLTKERGWSQATHPLGTSVADIPDMGVIGCQH